MTRSISGLIRTEIGWTVQVRLQASEDQLLENFRDRHEVCDWSVVAGFVYVGSWLLQQRNNVTDLENLGKGSGREWHVNSVRQRWSEHINATFNHRRRNNVCRRIFAFNSIDDLGNLLWSCVREAIKDLRWSSHKVEKNRPIWNQLRPDLCSNCLEFPDEELSETRTQWISIVRILLCIAAMKQIIRYSPDLSLIIPCRSQFLLNRVTLSSDDETVCIPASPPVDDSVNLAVASLVTFFTSAAISFSPV